VNPQWIRPNPVAPNAQGQQPIATVEAASVVGVGSFSFICSPAMLFSYPEILNRSNGYDTSSELMPPSLHWYRFKSFNNHSVIG